MGHGSDLLNLRCIQHRSAIPVVRVLDADGSGAWVMNVWRTNRRLDLGGIEHAVDVSDCPQLQRPHDRAACHLVMKDVRLIAEDYLVAPLRVGENSDKVSLRTGGDQNRRIFAHPLGGERLEAIDRGILAENIVT